MKAFFPAVREFVYNPNVKTPWYSRPTTLSATAVWSLSRAHRHCAVIYGNPSRYHCQGNRPTYEASRSEEASHADLAGQQCTHCLTNRCRASPPIPEYCGDFLMGKSKKNRAAATKRSSIKARLQPKHSASVIPFLSGPPRTAGLCGMRTDGSLV